MDKPGPIFLAFLLFLSMAISGPDFSADAHQDELEGSFEANASLLNLSGNSARRLFEVSKGPTPNVAYTKIAEQYFGALLEDNSTNVSQGGQEIELFPGFDVINNLITRPQDIHISCWNNDIRYPVPILVNGVISPGEADGWDLQAIDPGNQHVRYRCTWQLPGTNPLQEISHEAWVSSSSQYDHRMPFYCVRCSWKLLDDGLYLFNLNWKLFVKVSDWNVDGPEEET